MNWSAVHRDIRQGFRVLLQSPGFATVAILTIALGIGINAAMFSVVDALLLKPLPYRDPDRILVVWNTWPQKGFSRLPLFDAQYLDLARTNHVFRELAGFKLLSANLTGSDEPERLEGARASASLFSILGVPPLLGRTFSAAEDKPGADRVVVLSYELWQRRLAGDPRAVGRTVALDGRTYTVIGVLRPEFRFSMSVNLSKLTSPPMDFWLPLALAPTPDDAWASVNVYTIGRLKPGLRIAEAQGATESLIRDDFRSNHLDLGMGTLVASLPQEIHGSIGYGLLILSGTVICVLLVACANLAGLLLARGAARRHEIGIRMALGAGRVIISRQLLTEALLLSTVGGVLGILASAWITRLFLFLGPEDLAQLIRPAVDYRVLAFTTALTLLTAILFGIAPARSLSRVDVNDALRDNGRVSTGVHSEKARATLVIGQLSVAVMVLAAAMLLVRSLGRVLANDPGFTRHNILTMDIPLPALRYPDARKQSEFFARALDRIRAIHGVVAAAAIENPPLTQARERFIQIEDEPVDDVGKLPLATTRFASSGYLQVTGIPLELGRWLRDSDRLGAPAVAVADQLFANAHWPGRSPVGRHIRIGGGTTGPWVTIVGVVGAIRQYGLDADARPGLYLSYLQDVRNKMSIIIRTEGDPLAIASAVRAAVRSVDRDQPVAAMRTMDQLIARSLSNRSFETLLLSAFGLIALLLAALGLIGLLSWSVAQRTREIGIRVALGATSADVLWMVAGRAMLLVSTGLVIGGIGALGMTRVLHSLLYQVSTTDPITFLSVAADLLVLGALAAIVPAWRAVSVDPVDALRTE